MNTKKYLLIGATLTCSVGTFLWYTSVSGTIAQEDTTTALASLARPIPTTLVREAGTEVVRMFPGTVQARNNVDLAFSIEGPLVQLNAREGRIVKKGEVLAKLDERDFRNGHDAAKANYMRTHADFKRAETLLKRNVISQAEYDTAKAACDVALAEYKIRKKALEDTVITAPFDGVISQRYVENREHVKKQAPILALKDISEIEVIIQVPERLMAQGGIDKFTDIWARFDVGGERWFSGEVREYSVQSDPVTRTYEVAIRLQSPTDLAILPGMTATVRAALGTDSVIGGKHSGAVGLIPVESVYSASDGKTYTWLIPDMTGNPQKIEVQLGAMSDGNIEVINGLEPGTRIATAGIHSLTEEIQVRPMKENAEGLDG